MKKIFDTEGNLSCITFEKLNGGIASTVKRLSPQLFAETVFDGQKEANSLRIYLDGERPGSYGPDRPCLRVVFADDGKTIVDVALFNDPEGAELHWKR